MIRQPIRSPGRNALQALALITIIAAQLIGCAATGAKPDTPSVASVPVAARTALEPEKLEAMLARGKVIARIPARQFLSFHGIDAVARTDSTVYLNVSARGVAMAVLAGQMTLTGRAVSVGEVCFWSREATEVQVAEFDVRAFVASRSLPLDSPARSSLETVAARQASDLWWGTVERDPLPF